MNKLVLFIPFILLWLNVQSQDTVNKKYYTSSWFSIGAGSSTVGFTYELGLNTNVYKNLFVNLKYENSKELMSLVGDTEYSKELGFLFGYLLKEGIIAFATSAGISRISGHIKGDYYNNYKNGKDYKIISLPFEFKLMFVVSKDISIGFNYNLTVNSIKSCNGIMFSLGIGNIRNKLKHK